MQQHGCHITSLLLCMGFSLCAPAFVWCVYARAVGVSLGQATEEGGQWEEGWGRG